MARQIGPRISGPGLHCLGLEPALGGGFHLRADLDWHGLHRVRHRRALPADRGLAHRASRMPTELPLDALEMAQWTRTRDGTTDADGRLEGLVQHSDTGTQYVAFRHTEQLTAAGAVVSIGTVDDSFYNALAESFTGLYKNECVKHDGPFRTVDDLELGTLS